MEQEPSQTPRYPFDKPGLVETPANRLRRQFIKGGIGTAIAAVAAYFGWTQFVLAPPDDTDAGMPATPAAKPSSAPTPVGKVALYAVGTPVAVNVGGKDAFVVNDGEQVQILVNYCTHNGCSVAWQKTQFYCGCHGSAFNIDGAVLQGPAKRPMIVIPSHVQGDTLYAEV